MSDMIRCDNVSFRYDEEHPYVIEQLSIAVQKGEFVAVLGANGCGKSTLAKHFNAMLLPEAGTVWVKAMNTSEDELLWDIRQTVGMVFQNPDNQIVATVVEEDVAFALENLGVPPNEIRTRIDEAMKSAGIYAHKDRQPHKLSGGQKQRVAVAGVLAMNPECIVMDEATAMLDPRGRQKIMRTVKKLNKEQGITVVHITHYMEEATEADRVVVMDRGRVAFSGTPSEVFSRTKELQELHLDIPQSAELCEMLSEMGLEMPKGVTAVEQCAQLIYEKLTGKAPPERQVG